MPLICKAIIKEWVWIAIEKIIHRKVAKDAKKRLNNKELCEYSL